MFCNRKSTFYRYDYDNEVWERKTIWSYVFRTYSGKNEKGIETGDKAIIRIPDGMMGDFSVKVGDMVFIGSCELNEPPEGSMKIVLVRENTTGYNTHTRIEAIR